MSRSVLVWFFATLWTIALQAPVSMNSPGNNIGAGSHFLLQEIFSTQESSSQFSSVTQSCLTLRDLMDWSTLGLPIHHQLPEFIQTHVHWVSDAIQPSHPLSSPSLPAFNLSQHQGHFKWVSSSHQAAKLLEFKLNISPSNEHPGLIFFRMDWLDLLAVQRTLKSLLQHHSSKATILRHSAFFTVQLSHPYMTTGKTKAWLDEPF